MIKYGLNFNAGDIKDSLALMERQQNGVKTWQQLLGGASLGYENQVGALSSDFTDTIAEAYRANLLQRENIYRSGLGARETSSALRTNDANLSQAYMTYLSKYREGLSSAASAYGAETKAIQDAAGERSKNLADLYASAYDYWANELFGSTRQEDDLDKPIYEKGDDGKDKLVGYEPKTINLADNYDLDDLVVNDTARAWDDISHELLNLDGTLTERGRQFFDQMFNLKFSGYTRTDAKGNTSATRGFSQWLSDTNPDLYNWAMSPDAYNYTPGGTNFATAKTLLGLKSTDNDYGPADYTDWNKLNVKDFGYGPEASDQSVAAPLVNAFKESDRIAANIANLEAEGYPTAKVEPLVERARERAGEALVSYIDAVDVQRQEIADFATKGLGRTRYEEFLKTSDLVEKYDKVYNELKKALASVETLRAADLEKLVNDFNKIQQDYVKALAAFDEKRKS